MLSTMVMLLMISLLVILHELGHYWVARRCGVKVERFGIGLPFGPTLWRKKFGDTEYCVHLLLFGGYVAFPDDNEDSSVPKDSLQRFENQPLLNRAAIALAGVTVNAITAWVLMWLVVMQFGLSSGDILFAKTAGPDTPAAKAGILGGETVKAINGKPMVALQLEERLNFVKGSISASPKQPVQFDLLMPDGTRVIKTIVPDATGKIGVNLGAKPVRVPVGNPLTALKLAVDQTNFMLVKQVEALGQLVTGKVKMDEMSGMIGIVKIGSEVFDKYGFANGLEMIATLSMMLAFMNLLPIPALDGGHLLFIGLEALFRKPVPKIIQERAIMTGFVSLLLLMSFTLFNDIYKLANNKLNLPSLEEAAKPAVKGK